MWKTGSIFFKCRDQYFKLKVFPCNNLYKRLRQVCFLLEKSTNLTERYITVIIYSLAEKISESRSQLSRLRNCGADLLIYRAFLKAFSFNLAIILLDSQIDWLQCSSPLIYSYPISMKMHFTVKYKLWLPDISQVAYHDLFVDANSLAQGGGHLGHCTITRLLS